MSLVVARCGECGAALRLDADATQATCSYCGSTSYTSQTPANAPRIIIAPPPEVADQTIVTVVVGILFLGVTALGLYAAIEKGPGGWILFAIGLWMSGSCIVGYGRNKAAIARAQLLRDQGIPARATVRSVGAGHARNATLALDVEHGGQIRTLSHATTVPALLVPRVTAGARLPILIHPREQNEIEIQWHLL